jgi:hypothetical protein
MRPRLDGEFNATGFIALPRVVQKITGEMHARFAVARNRAQGLAADEIGVLCTESQNGVPVGCKNRWSFKNSRRYYQNPRF